MTLWPRRHKAACGSPLAAAGIKDGAAGRRYRIDQSGFALKVLTVMCEFAEVFGVPL